MGEGAIARLFPVFDRQSRRIRRARLAGTSRHRLIMRAEFVDPDESSSVSGGKKQDHWQTHWQKVMSLPLIPPTPPLEEHNDIPYVSGEHAEPLHKFDFYLPNPKSSTVTVEQQLPLIIFVHGGAWRSYVHLRPLAHSHLPHSEL